MDWKKTKQIIQKDIYRNEGTYSRKLERRIKRKQYSTTALLIYFRFCHYYCSRKNNFFEMVHYVWCNHRFKKLQNQCGIEINKRTEIGPGLRLPHKGGIVIHPNACLGNNCEIMQGVTIGNNILKSRDDVATIGNEVMICSGAKVIGNIEIGNRVIIGANAVVNKDVESNTIVGGIPAKKIGTVNNPKDYVINIDYPFVE